MSNERTMERGTRWFDRWGPLLAFVAGIVATTIGFAFGAGSAYTHIIDKINAADSSIAAIVSWKEKQEEFNKVVIAQIASLQALSPRTHE